MIAEGKEGMRLLRKTLQAAGLTDAEARKVRIVDYSPNDVASNVRVHASTNRTIVEAMQRNSLGECLHITGRAMALTDTYHRQVCEAMLWGDLAPFQVLYHVPPERRGGDDWSVVEYSLGIWGTKALKDWRKKLLTLDMIGKRGVELKAFDETDRVQYSVFGNRYAQIQAKHPTDARSKHVWLIESENVNGRLAELAQADLSRSTEIDEGRFRNFVSTVFSNSARRMLVCLTDSIHSSSTALVGDEVVSFLDPHPQRTLEALSILGLVEADREGGVRVTGEGRTFLDG